MKERNCFVDCLRGYACLLVVVYHVFHGVRSSGVQTGFEDAIRWAEAFILATAMPLFMFISGYIYQYTGKWSSKGSRRGFILYKLINLGIPYLFFSIVYIIINMMTPGTNTSYSLISIYYLWKNPVAQYWFLYTLFFLFVFWIICSNFLDDQWTLVVLAAINLIYIYKHISFVAWNGIVSYIIPFGVGVCMHKLYFDEINIKQKVIMLMLFFLLPTGFWVLGIQQRFYESQVMSLVTIFGSITFISIIYRIGIVKKLLMIIAKYSFQIYLLHTIFTSATRILLKKIGVNVFCVHIVIGILIGLVVPIGISIICSRSPILELFFYPSKSFKALRMRK